MQKINRSIYLCSWCMHGYSFQNPTDPNKGATCCLKNLWREWGPEQWRNIKECDSYEVPPEWHSRAFTRGDLDFFFNVQAVQAEIRRLQIKLHRMEQQIETDNLTPNQ